MALFGTLNGILGAGGAAPSRWFATAGGDQRFSDDFGATWSGDQNIIAGQTAVHGMPSGTWVMAEGNVVGRGLYQSDDNGDTFTFRNNFNGEQCFGMSADSSGNWVAVGENTVIKYSSNNGVTWSTANNPFTPSVIADPRSVTTNNAGDFICVGSGYNPGSHSRPVIAISTDTGVTWTAHDLGSGVADDFYEISQANGTWITVGSQGKLFRSTNTGTSWSVITTPFGTSTSDYITSITNFGGTWIIVGQDSTHGTTKIAISRSTDDGLTWSSFISNAATPNTSLGRNIDVDALGQFMIYYPQSGGVRVIKSTDDGVSWGSIVNAGLSGSPNAGLSAFSNNAGST